METRKKIFFFDLLLVVSTVLLPATIFSQTETLSTSLCGQTSDGSPCPGDIDVELYDFSYNITSGNPAFTEIVGWTTTGTYLASDITGFTLYVTNFCAFNTSTPLQTLPASGPGAKTFVFADPLPAGPAQRYFWITTNFTPGAVPGRTIRVNIITDAMTTITGTENFGTNTIGGLQTICNLLPIELLSFTGTNSERKNTLEWTTASETNNDFFTLEKSLNGIDFLEYTRVLGAGTTSESLNYEVVDINLESSQIYYRLKQTDFNGDFKYSEVIGVKSEESAVFELYPNPARSQIHILSNEKETSVDLFDMNGKKICSLTTNTDIDISFLEPGIYYINDRYGNLKKLIKY